tara:strand:+ start:228 stop:416 length:189 start_codon:yes stop_codon:yes gene_type:complete
MNDIDIFDYSNVMGILAGMSDKQLQTLATKLVNKFDKTADCFESYLCAAIADKIASENGVVI